MECARYSNYLNQGFDPDNVRCETKGSNSIAVMALTYNEPKGREGLGRKVTEVVLQHYMRRPSLKEIGLQKMTEFAHDAVCVEQSPGYAAECDLAVLMTQGNKFRWVCTGGSRIFYFLNGQIMDSSSGRTPRLGNGREKEMPDVLQETEFTKGENSFLICSDTFCKYVREAEMENALAASDSAEEWLQALKNLYEDRCTEEPFALIRDHHRAGGAGRRGLLRPGRRPPPERPRRGSGRTSAADPGRTRRGAHASPGTGTA